MLLAGFSIVQTYEVTPPAKNICKLQLIQNFACRIILGPKKLDHVSATRKSLGWLSVRQKLRLNTVTMVQKCRINQAPLYLCNLFYDRFSVSGRSTRNKSQLQINLPNADYQLINALSPFVGQKNTTYSQKTFRRLTISQVLKGKPLPTFL